MNRIFVLGALGALAVTPPLARLGAQERDVASRIDTTLTLARNGTVDLSLVSGEIVVGTGDEGRVRIKATSERGTLELDASPSRVSLGVRNYRGRSGETRYEVMVPRGTRVIASSTSGDIAVRGTGAEVDAHSVSGNVVVENAAERITMESVSGDVSGRGLGGNTRASAVSGDLDLADVRGDVEVETVSGDLTLDGITAKWVSAETVSGEVRYVGSADAGGRYEFTSHSGDIRLLLPANAGATFDVETFSGEIDSDFPITLAPGVSIEGRPRRFEFAVGGGGARISAETFSGDIHLARGTGRAGDSNDRE